MQEEVTSQHQKQVEVAPCSNHRWKHSKSRWTCRRRHSADSSGGTRDSETDGSPGHIYRPTSATIAGFTATTQRQVSPVSPRSTPAPNSGRIFIRWPKTAKCCNNKNAVRPPYILSCPVQTPQFAEAHSVFKEKLSCVSMCLYFYFFMRRLCVSCA